MKTPHHLSDEVLDSVLLGISSPVDEAHLTVCDQCAARVAGFRSSVHSFNHASAAWSEARSNTISRDLTPSGSVSSLSTAAGWSLAAAMILSVGLALRTSTEHETALQSPTTVSQASTDDIAGDNAMLNAIDSELSRPVASPIETYAPAQAPRRGVSREVRD